MSAARTAALAVATAISLASTVAPADAKTTVVATLGTSPLLGYNAGAGELRSNVRAKAALFDEAGATLGLTAAQRRELRYRIDVGHLSAVTVPRHLDAMTWASGGQVRVIRDVQIPAGTEGWETDLVANGQQIALFIPKACGNLSLIRRAAPRVAAARVTRTHVAAVAAPAVAPAPVAEVPAAVAPPAPAAETAMAVPVPAPPPPPRGFHPSLLAAAIPLLFGGLGQNGGNSTNAPAITTTTYTPPGTGTVVVPPGVPGTPPGTGTPTPPPGTGTTPPVTPTVGIVPTPPTPPPGPPPGVPGGPGAPPPPPPPPGIGGPPCPPTPCK